MLLLIKVLGSLLLCIGMMAFVFPDSMRGKLYFFFQDRWLSIISGSRILLGFFLVTAAPMSKHPTLLLVAGIIVITIGFGVPLLTRKQLIKTEIWWLERKQDHIRLLSLIPMGIGGILFFAGS